LPLGGLGAVVGDGVVAEQAGVVLVEGHQEWADTADGAGADERAQVGMKSVIEHSRRTFRVDESR
jgi:hypothetical protein